MPIYKNQPRTVAFQSLTTAGAANASAVSTQVSLDGGAFAATANTPQQVSTGSGCWKVALTAAEMNADLVVLLASAAGCVPSQRELYTESDWTSTRAAKVDNLDAAVSTRSTFAGTDTAGTTTLLSRLTAQRSTNLDNLDATVSSRSTFVGADTAGTTTLLSRLTAQRSTNLDNLDAAVSTRLASASYASSPTTAAIAGAILANPTNKLTTDLNGGVPLKLDQAVPVVNGSQTVGDALNAARAQGFGPWTLDANAKTLKLFAPDGTTVVRTFTLDSVTAPTARA